MIKLLIVDDEQMIRERMKTLLELEDYEVFTAEDAPKGLETFKEKKPDVVLTDLKMPGMDGIELLGKIREVDSDALVFVLTGHGGIESAISALKSGAFDYMTKPIDFDELCINIKRALETKNLRDQLKSQQAQLLQAAKLTAVGELGAGVAHEMNQPLMAISTHLETILMTDVVEENAKLKEKILKIKDQFTRLSTIVKRMHEYSGSRMEGFSPETINRPITDSIFLLTQQLKDHNIDIATALDEGLPQVSIDRYHIQDVVINFMINARDAIDDKFNKEPGGKITLVSRKLKDGKGILCGVIDNGMPVKEGAHDNIFDPFFTTKAPGKGTGLGLSVCYNIVKQHNGYIGFASLKDARKIFYFAVPLNKDNVLSSDGAFLESLKNEWGDL